MLISQWQVMVDLYVRNPDDTWTLTTLQGFEATLELVLPGAGAALRVPLAELYRRVQIAPVTVWRREEGGDGPGIG